MLLVPLYIFTEQKKTAVPVVKKMGCFLYYTPTCVTNKVIFDYLHIFTFSNQTLRMLVLALVVRPSVLLQSYGSNTAVLLQ